MDRPIEISPPPQKQNGCITVIPPTLLIQAANTTYDAGLVATTSGDSDVFDETTVSIASPSSLLLRTNNSHSPTSSSSSSSTTTTTVRPNRVVQLGPARPTTMMMMLPTSSSSSSSDQQQQQQQQEYSTINESQTFAAGAAFSLSTPSPTPSTSSTAATPVGSLQTTASNSNIGSGAVASLPPLTAGSVAAVSSAPVLSNTTGMVRRPRPRHDSESDNRMLSTSHKRTVYTAGRPPWYDWQDNRCSDNGSGSGVIGSGSGDKKPFVIGICGGSASGKTTVAKKIVDVLDVQWVSLVSMDSFYKVLTEEQHECALRSEYNFDQPSSFDIVLLVETLTRLKSWKSIEVPIYNFTTHSREKNTRTIYGANVVILEGIMAFCDQALLDLMDLRIFVDTDADIRLARRLTRDILERGRDLDGVLKQYNKFVKPAYENYIEPTRSKADIVVPRGGENSAAIKLIAQHVHNQLVARGNIGFRSKLGALGGANGCSHPNGGIVYPSTLYVLENTLQVKGIHTIIRNQDTSRDDFIFYSKRLMRLLIEYAVSLLPYRSTTVYTPQDVAYEGQRVDRNKTCAVSILRAGETLEPALRSVMKDIQIGKILIQTNTQTGEPELHYHRLPHDVANYHVLLLDATVSTGSAAIMAIRVLLDHDVKEENIILVSLLMAQVGAQNVAYCYPRVKIVTTAIDSHLDEHFYIVPGLGNFGDRFFGTD